MFSNRQRLQPLPWAPILLRDNSCYNVWCVEKRLNVKQEASRSRCLSCNVVFGTIQVRRERSNERGRRPVFNCCCGGGWLCLDSRVRRISRSRSDCWIQKFRKQVGLWEFVSSSWSTLHTINREQKMFPVNSRRIWRCKSRKHFCEERREEHGSDVSAVLMRSRCVAC
jgi:hypothetical protein